MKKELTAFLKNKAKELKSDWEDVSQWIIEATVEFIESKKPTKRQIIIDKASELLAYDSEKTTEQMIELIATNEDQTEIIDYIDGVEVWEKVEFSFTCEGFLEQIGYKEEDFK